MYYNTQKTSSEKHSAKLACLHSSRQSHYTHASSIPFSLLANGKEKYLKRLELYDAIVAVNKYSLLLYLT